MLLTSILYVILLVAAAVLAGLVLTGLIIAVFIALGITLAIGVAVAAGLSLLVIGAVMVSAALIGLVLGIAAVLLLGLLLAALGSRLPLEHQATDSIELKATPEAVFAALCDVASYPKWFTGVHAATPAPVPASGGIDAWHLKMGRNKFVNVTTVRRAPGEGGRPTGDLQRTIGDDNGAFSGTWTYSIEPLTPGNPSGGTRVVLTEHGRVPSPIPRAMMRYIMGYHMYTRKHLAALKKHVG